MALARDGHQHIDRDGNPNLSLHRILADAVEFFDAKILLDPFEQLIHILPINIVLRKSRSTTDSIPCVHRACRSSGSMSSMTNPTMSCGARMADRWPCRSG